MDEIERIARSLTKAQRDALCGLFSYSSYIEQDEGEVGLHRLGLWRFYPKHGESCITEKGHRVREYLENNDG